MVTFRHGNFIITKKHTNIRTSCTWQILLTIIIDNIKLLWDKHVALKDFREVLFSRDHICYFHILFLLYYILCFLTIINVNLGLCSCAKKHIFDFKSFWEKLWGYKKTNSFVSNQQYPLIFLVLLLFTLFLF